MAYIGVDINYGNIAKQTGTGDGSDTTPIAALTYTAPSNESILVFLDGVCQVPGTDFTATGTTLTFTTAPANGVAILVIFLGRNVDIGTPGDGTVDETKLKDALIGDFSDVTVTAADAFLYGDATDSGNTKKDTVQGILDLAVHTGNVAFPATQVASADANTLDDYEEGAWTPTLVCSTAGSPTYTAQLGRYTKIGRSVFFKARLVINSLGSASGNATIGGLPFTSNSTSGSNSAVHFGYGGSLNLTDLANLSGLINANVTAISLYHWNDTTGYMPPATAALITDGAEMYFGGYYDI